MRIATFVLAAVSALGAFATPQVINYTTGELSEGTSASAPERTATQLSDGYEVNTEASVKTRISNIGNKTVREDRVWQYASVAKNWKNQPEPRYEDAILLNLRFSGTTKILDKTYYNCYIYPASEQFDPENSCLYCYVREDNGKIYTYSPTYLESPAKYMDYDTYQLLGKCLYDDVELLAYDFNLKNGEDYHPYPELPLYRNYHIKGASEESGFDLSSGLWWQITDIRETEVGNMPSTEMDVASGYDASKHLFTAVEGVGRTSGFCNFMPIPIWQSNYLLCDCEKSDLTLERFLVFNNLYDLDGNIIYPGEGLKEGEFYTPDTSGISPAAAEREAYDVYGIDGRLVRRAATDLTGLAPGIYISDGKKILIK